MKNNKSIFKKVVNKVKEVVRSKINDAAEVFWSIVMIVISMKMLEIIMMTVVKVVEAIAGVVIHTEDLLAAGVKGTAKGLSDIASKIKRNSTYIGICAIGLGVTIIVAGKLA